MTPNRQITAFFDSRSDAEQAIARLTQAGIARSEIQLVEGDSSASATRTPSNSSASGYEDKGFWASLSDMFMPDEDRYTYAEGLARGGYVVSVNASDAQYERALDILDDDGTINLDERAAGWRNEGWQGYSRGAAGGAQCARALRASSPVPAQGFRQRSCAL